MAAKHKTATSHITLIAVVITVIFGIVVYTGSALYARHVVSRTVQDGADEMALYGSNIHTGPINGCTSTTCEMKKRLGEKTAYITVRDARCGVTGNPNRIKIGQPMYCQIKYQMVFFPYTFTNTKTAPSQIKSVF